MKTCDACPAPARVVVARGYGYLMLCWHHYNEHAEALYAAGWLVQSEDPAEDELMTMGAAAP